MECETQENEAGYTKKLKLYLLKVYMCRYRVNQHLIVLNLKFKILVKEFITVKVSLNLNLM